MNDSWIRDRNLPWGSKSEYNIVLESQEMPAIWKVETPTGTTLVGTAAKPFISHHNDLNMDMYVLVELYRKVQQCNHIRMGI